MVYRKEASSGQISRRSCVSGDAAAIHDVRAEKKRKRTRRSTSKYQSMEGVKFTLVASIALWVFLFGFQGNNDTDVDQLKDSKSSFFDNQQRLSLKSYLAGQEPLTDAHAVGGKQLMQVSEQAKEAAQQELQQKLDSIDRFYSSQRRTHSPNKNNLNINTPEELNDATGRVHKRAASSWKPDKNQKVLTAYLEPQSTLQEDVKPLPRRRTSRSFLEEASFPQVLRCSTLMQDFGTEVVDNFPSKDPYLPWIHDFFPTNDGTMMKFVGQNRRNCQTGDGMYASMRFWKSQMALFQSVPVVVSLDSSISDAANNEPSIRLADSFEAATFKATRFICRFHNSTEHSASTLSEFPFDYEFVTWRKNSKMLESDKSKNSLNQSPFWLSQLLFSCPIPPEFQAQVREGQHVVNDIANLWVDVIPIRTPPRSDKFLLTRDQVGEELYRQEAKSWFHLDVEYGKNHTLPPFADSGRWANLPICYPPRKPSREQSLPKSEHSRHQTKPVESHESRTQRGLSTTKPHHLVACTWTSSSYQRRGNVVTVRDSPARLREWILFHKLVGFDHVYVYDNSPNTETDHEGLESVTKEFPSDLVTHIRWPCTACSNNRPMHKNPGDRSSQYAAEASCRERFGPFTKWMSFIDTDEYLVPMKHNTWTDLLDDMESKNIQVLKMRSSRGLPRHDLMQSLPDDVSCEIPTKRSAAVRKLIPKSCQEPKRNETFLNVYNCDFIKPPRPDRFARAMKQIYRPSYVMSHFVHYSTVTKDIALFWSNQSNVSINDHLLDWREAGSEKEVFLDEFEQGTLIHARSVLPHETIYRSDMCKSNSKHKCPLGYVCPGSTPWIDDKEMPNNLNPFVDDHGHYCNCWVNEQVANNMVPRLEKAVLRHRNQQLV